MYPVFAFLDNPVTMLVLGALAVLLFGERLPEVARSIGKGLMEVKNGMHGIQQEIENAVNSATTVDTSSRFSLPGAGRPRRGDGAEVRAAPFPLKCRRRSAAYAGPRTRARSVRPAPPRSVTPSVSPIAAEKAVRRVARRLSERAKAAERRAAHTGGRAARASARPRRGLPPRAPGHRRLRQGR